uniref:Putative secreted protein n=1 Tax=Ixodes ricinus TaxID=34613 RepID=A0A6B0U7F7_IXORI
MVVLFFTTALSLHCVSPGAYAGLAVCQPCNGSSPLPAQSRRAIPIRPREKQGLLRFVRYVCYIGCPPMGVRYRKTMLLYSYM